MPRNNSELIPQSSCHMTKCSPPDQSQYVVSVHMGQHTPKIVTVMMILISPIYNNFLSFYNSQHTSRMLYLFLSTKLFVLFLQISYVHPTVSNYSLHWDICIAGGNHLATGPMLAKHALPQTWCCKNKWLHYYFGNYIVPWMTYLLYQ